MRTRPVYPGAFFRYGTGMQRLMLLRHAKSLMAEPGQRDRDRGLSQRGYRDAVAIGRAFASHLPYPDLVLCSAARRTRETLAAVLPRLEADTVIRVTGALYDHDAPTYFEAIAELAGPARSVLVIGHNPTIHATAIRLAGHGAESLRARVAAKFPTGALAVIDLPDGGRADVADGAGTLTAFVQPADLQTG